MKKKWYKRWWAIALFILAGIIIISLFAPEPEEKLTSPEDQQEVSTPQDEKEEAGKELIPPISEPETESQAESEPEPISEEESQPEIKTYLVVRVIDGDTIEIEGGKRVRYIGINTPETSPVECFGVEATNKNKELVGGKRVRLEKDISELDKYGRLLRYVWVGDIFVNDYLVRQGYAYATTYPPDVEYSNQFVQAQREAKENNRGLWAGCQTEPEPEPEPEITSPSSAKVEIIYIFYDGIQGTAEPDEYVEIKNTGGTAQNLNGWTLSDIAGKTYIFPSYNLQPNESIKIYTNMGTFTFGSGRAIWNNGGDTAYLKDNAGNPIDTYSY